MSSTAEEVWNLCEAYIPLARKHLSGFPIPAKPLVVREDEKIFEYEPEILRVLLLFPLMPRETVDLFVECRRARFAVMANKFFDDKSGRTNPDLAPERVEAIFEDRRKVIEDSLRTFSAVQQEILLKHFLGVEEE